MAMSATAQPAGQLCFEDAEDGTEITQIKGPLGTPQIMRWSAAVENWHKIHYDAPFATGHDKLPGLLINGSLKQQFLAQLLKDWAGQDGFLWKMSFQFRAMTLVGDTLTLWTRVSGRRRLPAFGLVDLELGIRNGDGSETTPGKATVALPYRGGAPVPYPFAPPTVAELAAAELVA